MAFLLVIIPERERYEYLIRKTEPTPASVNMVEAIGDEMKGKRFTYEQVIGILNGSTVSGNTTYLNGSNGIDAGYDSTIIDNTSYDNGDATNPTLDDGIQCFNRCIVRGNSVRLRA